MEEKTLEEKVEALSFKPPKRRIDRRFIRHYRKYYAASDPVPELGPPARQDDESFQAYRKRLKREQFMMKWYLAGRLDPKVYDAPPSAETKQKPKVKRNAPAGTYAKRRKLRRM